ncbi:hypothetical protein ONS95_005818 [Cadophora gregata]|uniref:uncharacterized protein n=1 Tax=Cadophora gregata TaxID=51156 RepID=UPI0026DB6F08|nr:uncharacterized protein ONS95_005818 [Cadophora gregata]KAK0103819.1 hypothetical protein ONS95_005818 [Cadophora gregata]KAK0108004.1 hypothetical protein ONS96_003783 [Cadophora gregata f. sp. sojae]
MKASTFAFLLELFAAAQAQTAIISESPLMTAPIIAPPAAPGGANPAPPQGPAMPAPVVPLATGSPQVPGGDPIIDLRPLMTAGIIAGSMNLNGAAGIPQPPNAPAPSINSGSLAQAGIVGGPAAGPQATSPPAAMNPGAPGPAAPPLPPGINSATLMTAGIVANSQPTSGVTAGIPQPAAANPSAIQSATLTPAGIVQGGNTTTTNPTGGLQGLQPAAGNSSISVPAPATNSGRLSIGTSYLASWMGCIMTSVYLLI